MFVAWLEKLSACLEVSGTKAVLVIDNVDLLTVRNMQSITVMHLTIGINIYELKLLSMHVLYKCMSILHQCLLIRSLQIKILPKGINFNFP